MSMVLKAAIWKVHTGITRNVIVLVQYKIPEKKQQSECANILICKNEYSM